MTSSGARYHSVHVSRHTGRHSLGAATRDSPKSQIFSVRSWQRRRLLGLRSRCIMLMLCRKAMPCRSSRDQRSTTGIFSLCFWCLIIWCRSVMPGSSTSTLCVCVCVCVCARARACVCCAISLPVVSRDTKNVTNVWVLLLCAKTHDFNFAPK